MSFKMMAQGLGKRLETLENVMREIIVDQCFEYLYVTSLAIGTDNFIF